MILKFLFGWISPVQLYPTPPRIVVRPVGPGMAPASPPPRPTKFGAELNPVVVASSQFKEKMSRDAQQYFPTKADLSRYATQQMNAVSPLRGYTTVHKP